jgi:hypothetical protein
VSDGHSIKADPGKVCIVESIPQCDFCGDGTPGPYDFKTIHGPWAHGCKYHWMQFRTYPALGVGKGQLWVLNAD